MYFSPIGTLIKSVYDGKIAIHQTSFIVVIPCVIDKTLVLSRHGRESGNGKTGTGKVCRENGNGKGCVFPVTGKAVFFPLREKREREMIIFPDGNFPCFPVPQYGYKK